MTALNQTAEVVATANAAAGTSRRRVLRSLLGRPATFLSIAFLLMLFVTAVLAPVIAPHDPYLQQLDNAFASPGAEHLLGTDKFGRDVFSRILYAGQIALIAPLIAVGVAALLGIPAGLLAGMKGGRIDTLLSTVSDTLLSIPALVFAMAVIAVLGKGLTYPMIAVGIMLAPALFRIVRGSTLVVAEETYIKSAEAIGSPTWRTMLRHVLPNISAPLLVQVTLLMALSLLVEASLSFLGLGVQPPDASWGSMLKAAYESQFDAPWAVVPPGIAIVLTVLSFNTLGDGLRDILAGRRSDD